MPKWYGLQGLIIYLFIIISATQADPVRIRHVPVHCWMSAAGTGNRLN
jgi:hypothetical protein